MWTSRSCMWRGGERRVHRWERNEVFVDVDVVEGVRGKGESEQRRSGETTMAKISARTVYRAAQKEKIGTGMERRN